MFRNIYCIYKIQPIKYKSYENKKTTPPEVGCRLLYIIYKVSIAEQLLCYKTLERAIGIENDYALHLFRRVIRKRKNGAFIIFYIFFLR